MRAALPLVAIVLTSATAPSVATVEIDVVGLRSLKGQVLACLTATPRAFPDCSKDRAARRLAVPSTAPMQLRFAGLPPGTYAVALVHDENGNGKLDTTLLLPREGFGFSRDAKVRMGPPKFAAAAFHVGERPMTLPITMRYLW